MRGCDWWQGGGRGGGGVVIGGWWWGGLADRGVPGKGGGHPPPPTSMLGHHLLENSQGFCHFLALRHCGLRVTVLGAGGLRPGRMLAAAGLATRRRGPQRNLHLGFDVLGASAAPLISAPHRPAQRGSRGPWVVFLSWCGFSADEESLKFSLHLALRSGSTRSR